MKILKQRGLTWSGAIRLLSANLRESGIRTTARKVLAQLSQSEKSFDIARYTRWFECHEIENASEAEGVFAEPMVVILGALDIPQCKKYRVLQKVEYFSLRGISCKYCEYRDLNRAFSLMQLATVVIFYRIPRGLESNALISETQRLGICTYYDIDDPIFDHNTYQGNRNLDTLSPTERDALLAQTVSYRQIMEQVGKVVVSTEEMRKLAQREMVLRSVLVWPNLIDGATRSVVEQLPPRTEKKVDEVVLGYFSGSRAHDADFEVIAESLVELFRLHPSLRLFLGGYASLPASLEVYGDRIQRSRFMSYPAYLQNLRGVDVNLVPLLIDPFNNCKSGIRFLEASICGIPTVASNVGQFKEMICHGKTGYLCGRPQDWETALSTLIESADLRQKIGAEANRHVLQAHALDSTDYAHLEGVARGAA